MHLSADNPTGDPAEPAAALAADPLLALAVAALADGSSSLHGVAVSPDVEAMLAALTAVGLNVRATPAEGLIEVHGAGGMAPLSEVRLRLGQPAALAAMLALLAAGVGQGTFVLDGDANLDLTALTDALRDLQAGIGFESAPGRPPVQVFARGLRGCRVALGPAAADFVPALLIALPLAGGDVLLDLPAGQFTDDPPIRQALELMLAFGVETIADSSRGRRIIVPAPQRYRGRSITLRR